MVTQGLADSGERAASCKLSTMLPTAEQTVGSKTADSYRVGRCSLSASGPCAILRPEDHDGS
jgi:hypothetical protein